MEDRLRSPFASFTLLILLNVAVWGWSVRNEFVFDDLTNILANPWIRDWRLLPQAFVHHAAGFDSNYSTSFYRPMMHVFYGITYAAAGPRPWAYHLLNVALNLAIVLCVYVFCRAAMARWSGRRDTFVPLIAALVFSVHPVHTEPVLWVAGITDLSYAAFGLLALIAYVRAFDRARFALVAALLFWFSLLSKETGAVFLVLMILLESLEARNGPWRAREAVRRLLPAFIMLAVYLVLRLIALGSFAPSAAQHPRPSMNLLASACTLFAHYLATLAAPVGLSVMRPIDLDHGLGEPAALLGLFASLVLAAIAWRFRRSSLTLLPLAFAVLPILPVLYAPAIESGGTVFGERYLYLPVLGIGLAAALVLDEVRRRFPSGGKFTVAVVSVFLLWGASTALARNEVWSNSLNLWMDAAAKAPDSAAAHEGLCFALYNAGRIPQAAEACGRALGIEPGRVDARINYGTALLALGRPNDAKTQLDLALAARPRSAQALVNRGLALMMLGRADEGMASYRRALELAPNYAEAHNVMGVALVRRGRRAEALAHLERAVELAPDNAEYLQNLLVVRRGG